MPGHAQAVVPPASELNSTPAFMRTCISTRTLPHLRAPDLDAVKPHELGGGSKNRLQLPYSRREAVEAPEQGALGNPPRVVWRLFLRHGPAASVLIIIMTRSYHRKVP